MRPYSLDLRERIVAAVDHHEGSIRWIARVFRVSTSFIVRLLQHRRDTGTLAPKPHRGGPPPALGPDDLERLAELGPRAARRHAGATEAARRLPVQPEDPVVRPRPPGPDPQEEEPARQPARPARRPDAAASVPAGGPAGSSRRAGFRGRNGGHHRDDAGLRLGAAGATGGRLGPRLVGDGDRDRGLGAGRGPCPGGVPRGRPTRRRSRRTWSRCWCRNCTKGTWWSSTTSSPT